VVNVGKVEAHTIREWSPEPGKIVSWHPTPASIAKVKEAPVSEVPASYMQFQHLRNYHKHATHGREMSRLLISSWDIQGRCDVRAMTHVINAHLRRHDTYRSWFERTDDGDFVRHTVTKPTDINFVATQHGEMTSDEQWRELLLATPTPQEWDCFAFFIIQRADHFTFAVAMDHLHSDAMFIGVAFAEIHLMYSALASGGAPLRFAEPGSYDDYCLREQEYIQSLTLATPEVRKWVEFFERNGGTLPGHPIDMGDTTVDCTLIGERLLDERQTAAFEAACTAAGVRFCGGVFAAAALVENQLTGTDTYHAIIPIDIRRTPVDFMTTGWFTGHVPITVPTTGASFAEIARAAQESFDSGRSLADVPLDTVLELAPWLREGDWGAPLLFYLDAGLPPLSAMVNSAVEGMHAKLCHDGGLLGQLNLRVNRLEDETQLTVLYPDNATARESVARYMEALRSVMVRIAEGRDVMPARPRNGALHLAYSRRAFEPSSEQPLEKRRTG
jgi:mycolipenoyl-CoA---2-(long-chain-fatty acyl)-trehalose mycolipenoyltransferase / long-chain-acyl-CoA---trehalose acyltransferase